MKSKKILNKRDMRGKPKYLVRWKRYIAKEDTWKELENLENTIDLVKDFEKKIRENEIRKVQMRKKRRRKEY